jgi:membrane associated rhomboid family serine protease
MLPLRDENPSGRFPVVTALIILANVLVFFWQLSLGLNRSVIEFGLIPAELIHHANTIYQSRQLGADQGVSNVDPAWISVFSSMFMHGGWMHIIGNMWFLWLFGNNVEEAMGSVKYAVFYVVSGVAAAAAQIVVGSDSPIPMVGASGAIGGVLGAYLVLFPGARVVYLSTFIVLGVVELPAYIGLGMYFILQVISSLGALGSQAGGTAYAAHVGGFVAGILLGRILGRVEVRHPRGRAPANADFMDWR